MYMQEKNTGREIYSHKLHPAKAIFDSLPNAVEEAQLGDRIATITVFNAILYHITQLNSDHSHFCLIFFTGFSLREGLILIHCSPITGVQKYGSQVIRKEK